ncbi:MAG: efflux RND transporter periplasmic adaptor subunit, partial [Lysobacterales bacterium]
AAAGLVEGDNGNVNIGSPVAGIVTEVFVRAGDRLRAGEPLFKVDDRDLRAQLKTAEAALRLAEVSEHKPEHHLDYARNLKRNDSSAVTPNELSDLRDDVAAAKATRELDRARLEQIETEIERHTIRAPADGEVLKLNVRVGEFVEASRAPVPLLLFARTDKRYVRADIDETDIWKFSPDAKAVAVVRGSSQPPLALHFDYVEPYVLPKQTFTGRSTERTDRRVLQVVYRLDATEPTVYVGQQLDVYIRAAPTAAPRAGGN